MKMRMYPRAILVVTGAVLIAASAFAGVTRIDAAEKADALQFAGAWKNGTSSDGVILIYVASDGYPVVRGQDKASVWNARCTRRKPGEYVCEGTGEMLADGHLFLFSSTMKIKNGRIEDEWRAVGRKDGKLDTTTGIDLLEKIAAPH